MSQAMFHALETKKENEELTCGEFVYWTNLLFRRGSHYKHIGDDAFLAHTKDAIHIKVKSAGKNKYKDAIIENVANETYQGMLKASDEGYFFDQATVLQAMFLAGVNILENGDKIKGSSPEAEQFLFRIFSGLQEEQIPKAIGILKDKFEKNLIAGQSLMQYFQDTWASFTGTNEEKETAKARKNAVDKNVPIRIGF